MTLQPGQTILKGKYRIEERIGKGAFAEVYRATHLALHRQVAIKVLRRTEEALGSTRFQEYRDRFALEAELGAQFDDPHIVKVFDFEEDAGGGVLYLVMEYAPGSSLAKKLEEGGPLPVEETVRLARDVAQGLALLHNHKPVIVHRDLKPSNILYGADGTAKVGDLGLAQVPKRTSRRSVAGSLAERHPGTPEYMCPEQEETAVYLRPACDVWALGAVLFEALTGSLYKDVKPGTRVRDLRAEVPAWLDELVMRCVAEEWKSRPWDGAEVLAALEAREAEARREAEEQARREQERAEREKARRTKLAEGARKLEEGDWAGALAVAEELLAAHLDDAEAAVLKQQAEAAQREAEEQARRETEDQARREVEERARRKEKERKNRPVKKIPEVAQPERRQSSMMPWIVGTVLLFALAAFGFMARNEAMQAQQTEVPAKSTSAPAAPKAAVEDSWGVVTVKKGEPIQIGFAAGVSGNVANLGIDERNGAELAIKDFPKAKDFAVKMVAEDSLCSGEGGTAVANKFAANPQIVSVVGHMCSSSSIPASDIYEKAHIVMISPSSTAVAFTARGLQVVNRVCWNDAIQGAEAAKYVKDKLGVSKVAILHDGSAYGQGLMDVFKASFEKLGGTITDYEGITMGDKDFRAVLTKIAANKPELIYFGGFQAEGALLVQQKDEVGLKDAIFFSDDGTKSDQYIEAATGAAEGSYATFADFPAGSDKLATFKAKYEKAYNAKAGELGPFNAHAYDAMAMMIAAINKVAVVDDAGNLEIGRKALADAVRGMKDYAGVTGNISCDDKGDCGTGTVVVNVVKGGKWIRVR